MLQSGGSCARNRSCQIYVWKVAEKDVITKRKDTPGNVGARHCLCCIILRKERKTMQMKCVEGMPRMLGWIGDAFRHSTARIFRKAGQPYGVLSSGVFRDDAL